MLCFLYTGNYHDEGQDPSSDVVPIDVEQIIKMDVQPSVNASLILVTLSAASQRHTPPNPREKITVDANTLLNNVSVYAIADKYDVPELKELAICKFKTRCVGHWNDDVITTIAKAVYESTPANDRALRDQMVRICHIYAYRINKYLPFRSLLSENGEIALELLDVTLASLKRRDTFLSQVAELMKWQRNRLRSSEGG